MHVQRHLTIRLQLAWLTVVALATFLLLAALRPDGDIVAAQMASSLAAFRASLQPAASIDTLNLFRAQLAADMIFLLAYGLLLRQSVLFVGRHRLASLVRRGVVALMVADAVENLTALTVLRLLIDERPDAPSWLFITMNGAAVIKWTLAGLVMGFLSMRWRQHAPRLRGPLRFVGMAGAVAFAIGAIASILVAFSSFVPAVRAVAAPAAVFAPALALLLQLRLLDMLGLMLRFIYLTRVPMLVLFLAAAFGPIALGPFVRLLGGIIDVASAWGVGIVTAAGLVLAFACGTQINLVRAYGWQRTFDPTLKLLRHRVLARAVSWTTLAAIGSLLFSVTLASTRLSTTSVVLAMAGGVLVAMLFLFVVELTAAWLSPSRPAHPLPQLAFPFGRAPLLGRWLHMARDLSPRRAQARAGKGGMSLAGRLFGLRSGYIELDASGRRRLLPGHTFALIQLTLSGLFYVVLIVGKMPAGAASSETALWVPTAGSFVLLLLLSSWALAGTAFFLDRYRTPLLTAVLALALATGSIEGTDYEVTTTSAARSEYALATPGQVLRAFPRPLLVAAAGGGIQAGAWTARALQGIDEQLNGALRERVALISGVSGGSMGALYYGAFHDASLLDASTRAMEPSLDNIASAFIGPELLRVAGVRAGNDRGSALEESWAVRLPSTAPSQLRAWAERTHRYATGDASEGPFPAFLFNTTVVETGQPLAFATTQFPTASYRASFSRALKQYPVVESANSMFELMAGDERAIDVGFHAVTAARLSAAFPYVSPAATIAIEERPRYHLVDGGYYDNYGLIALSQWLDDALTELADPPSEVGVLIVRGLVGSESPLERDLRASEDQRQLRVGAATVRNRGWAWQITAPPSAFLNTRTFGQWAGGNQALKLLTEKWAQRGVTITPFLFDFPVDQLPPACRVSPLSWKLSAPQQDCIHQGWQARVVAGSDLWNNR